MPRPSPVLPHALPLPIFQALQHRRVILASASPRRKDLLRTSGLAPEVVPSTFEEDLDKAEFRGRAGEYPVLTAQEKKGIEVYERLVQQDDRDPPDLVISADTVVIYPPSSSSSSSSAFPAEHQPASTPASGARTSKKKDTGGTGTGDADEAPEPGKEDLCEILEKPQDKTDQMRMLQNMSGGECEIVTGVAIVYPCIEHPGYKVLHMSCSSLCHFYDNSEATLQAYVDSEEGLDRAGGFAIQGLGGLLVESVEGNYDNIVGFPLAPFWRWMGELMEVGTFDDAWE